MHGLLDPGLKTHSLKDSSKLSTSKTRALGADHTWGQWAQRTKFVQKTGWRLENTVQHKSSNYNFLMYFLLNICWIIMILQNIPDLILLVYA